MFSEVPPPLYTKADCGPEGHTTNNCSWSHYGYDIGYAVSETGVLGQYEFKGSLQWSPPYDCGGGPAAKCHDNGGDNNHQGIVEFPRGSGRLVYFYHNRFLAPARDQYNGYQRNIAVDNLYVQPGGNLQPVAATPSWLKPVKFLNPYQPTSAFTMHGAAVGLDTEACNDTALPGAQRLNIGFTYNTSWIYVRAVDFGLQEPTAVLLRVATPLAYAAIELRLGGPGNNSSAAAAVCNLPANGTGDWQVWATVNCSLPSGSGLRLVQDLTFVFVCQSPADAHDKSAGGAPACGATGGVLNFAWWQFLNGAPTGLQPQAIAAPVALSARGAKGLYLSAVGGQGTPLVAAATNATDVNARLLLVDNEDGTWGIQAAAAGNGSVCVDASGRPVVNGPPGPTPQVCQQFRLQGTTDGSFALQSLATGGWLRVLPDGRTLLASGDVSNPRGLQLDAGRFDLVELPWSWLGERL